MSKMIKVTVNLSEENVRVIEDLAAVLGITKTEVLRRAIGTEKFLFDTQKEGGKVLIEKGNTLHQLLLR